MALAVKVQPITKDVQQLLLEDLISPRQRSAILAEFARVEIEAAKAYNRSVLGRVPPIKIYVDGQLGKPLTAVQPGGVIVGDFQLVNEVLSFIGEQLVKHSPFKTGRYERSHRLFADGAEIEPGIIPLTASEYVFMNLVPYARKIERGSSIQAPDGVYQVVALLARQKFSNLASINFSYRTAIGGEIIGGPLGNRSQQRNPAIIVRPR